jgi:hypothetical protein
MLTDAEAGEYVVMGGRSSMDNQTATLHFK